VADARAANEYGGTGVTVTVTLRRVTGLLVFCSLLGGSPLWAQTWPPRVQVILDELARQHPSWVADDTGGPENTPRYRLNKMVAEQVVCDLGPQYGLKRAGPGRPISSEVIAFNNGSVFIGWEWENTHDGRWEQFPQATDLLGQIFVPVACVHHLADAPPPPVPTPGPVVPTPGTPPVIVVPSGPVTCAECAEILTIVKETREDVKVIRSGMDRALKFTAKFILPPLAAAITAWKTKPDTEQK
jgi:hypothetical protein